MLREIAIITGLIALAGPRFGTEYEQVIPRGADLYVLIDVCMNRNAGNIHLNYAYDHGYIHFEIMMFLEHIYDIDLCHLTNKLSNWYLDKQYRYSGL